MKVGTDGTMLGCWTNVFGAENILDVGCGSGVLSVICAQKNPIARIVGLDVEDGAIMDATANIDGLDPSWKERIFICQTRLQDFQASDKLDVIISNPPFFENSQISSDDARNYARHTNSLHYSDLFEFAQVNLVTGGRINLVLPFENGMKAIDEASSYGLFSSRVCTVYPVPHKSPHRLLIELTNVETNCEKTSLTIETGLKRHDYTEEYKELGKDFYLYF